MWQNLFSDEAAKNTRCRHHDDYNSFLETVEVPDDSSYFLERWMTGLSSAKYLF